MFVRILAARLRAASVPFSRHPFIAAALVAAVGTTAQAAPLEFNIPAQPLAQALPALGQQANLQVDLVQVNSHKLLFDPTLTHWHSLRQ